jgi:hypothetical protein
MARRAVLNTNSPASRAPDTKSPRPESISAGERGAAPASLRDLRPPG